MLNVKGKKFIVTFVINSLSGAGGAERVITLMANFWAEKGWRITVVTLEDDDKPPFYELHANVNQVRIILKEKNANVFKRIINYITKYVKIRRNLLKDKNQVIISFTTGTSIKVLRAMLFSNIPIIVAERNINPRYIRSFRARCFRNVLYQKSRYIVCQTQAMAGYFPSRIRHKSVVIPNPIPKIGDISKPEIPLPKGKILFAAGYMNAQKMHQKGFDLLLPIFKNLAKKHSNWHLVILNDGPQKDVLKNLIKQQNLQGRVHLPGKVKDIHSVFKKGDLFVLSSRYEGFPNALCEAMACGLPTIAFNCPSGPGDIIRHGVDGILVMPEDEVGMERALDELMSNDIKRVEMGRRAVDIVERFSVEKIMNKWESLLYKVQR